MRFLNERIVTPSTSTSTISNARPRRAASPRPARDLPGLRLPLADRYRRGTLQPRNDDVQKVGDLPRAVEEHVEVAAGGIEHVLARLEVDLVRGRIPASRSTSGVPSSGRSRASRFSVAVRGAALRMHAPHPRHVLARQRDHEVGGVELLRRGLAAAVIGDRQAERRDGVARAPAHRHALDHVRSRGRDEQARARARAGTRPPSPSGPRCRCRASRCEVRSCSGACPLRHSGRGHYRSGRMLPVPYTLVLLRHGQSEWNLKNLFTGWVDVDLTEQGRDEARRGGTRPRARRRAARHRAHVASRCAAIRTAELALDECARKWIPVRRSWRLNERHYGDLQGKDKRETTRAVRRRQGEGVAAFVRRAAARPRSDTRRERQALGLRRALRRTPPRRAAPLRVPEGRARAHAAVVVRRDRARSAHRRDRARRRARQLARARWSSISTA